MTLGGMTRDSMPIDRMIRDAAPRRHSHNAVTATDPR